VGGQARVVHPHPQFRLILALDPRHGEVSRAMRNRGIELFLLPPPPPALASFSSSGATATDTTVGVTASADGGAAALYTATNSHTSSNSSTDGATQGALPGTLLQDACAVVVGEGAGAGGPALVKVMGVAHVRAAALAVGAMRRPPTLSQLRGWVRLVRALLQRGWGVGAALKEAWDLVSGCVKGEEGVAEGGLLCLLKTWAFRSQHPSSVSTMSLQPCSPPYDLLGTPGQEASSGTSMIRCHYSVT
jgi:midasin